MGEWVRMFHSPETFAVGNLCFNLFFCGMFCETFCWVSCGYHDWIIPSVKEKSREVQTKRKVHSFMSTYTISLPSGKQDQYQIKHWTMVSSISWLMAEKLCLRTYMVEPFSKNHHKAEHRTNRIESGNSYIPAWRHHLNWCPHHRLDTGRLLSRDNTIHRSTWLKSFFLLGYEVIKISGGTSKPSFPCFSSFSQDEYWVRACLPYITEMTDLINWDWSDQYWPQWGTIPLLRSESAAS